ncbi:MAG: DUF167 domain-containing protein [Planctomycetaceae bacterium]|nr:DUF167 domain-containing protein [Planctomycetaceae bacterium]
MTAEPRRPAPQNDGAIPLTIEPHAAGAVLAVLARAGGRTNAIQGIRNGELRISVTQVPEKGKANKVLCEILSAALQVPKSRVELLTGATNPRKRYLVHGLTPQELRERVQASLPPA